MGKKAQKKNNTASTEPKETAAAPAPAVPTPAPAPVPAETKPAETKPAAEQKQQQSKKAAAAKKPAEDEWTLVTNKRRNGRKKMKKNEEQEKEQTRRDGQAGFGGRAGQPHGRDFRNRRSHIAEEIVPVEHSTATASVALFVTNEQEEDALRKVLEGRPFEIMAVATVESVAHFSDPERKAKVRVLAGVDAVRALMKELGFGLFVLPVDDDNLPGPRMNDDVAVLLDIAVRAGAYAMTVSITPLETDLRDNRMFFAAVPTQESMQLLINTLGVVTDKEVRQDFEIHGFDIPEKAGLFDIYTSLMNSAIKKYKTCGEGDVLPNGDQFIQDVAANIKTAAHYPVFTVSFKVGKLDSYRSSPSKRLIYEIHSDDLIPETLKNIYILLGVPIRQKLTIIVCKYQGEVMYECEDVDLKVDVEFEKIIYSNSSCAESPVYELYLPRYVDPTAVPVPAAAAAPAAETATKTEEVPKKEK